MDLSKSTFGAHLGLSIAGAAGYALSFQPFSVVGNEGHESWGGMDLVVIVPTLSTNLLSTGLIAWKAWCVLLASDPRQLSLTKSLA
jgi:hypothetical protein